MGLYASAWFYFSDCLINRQVQLESTKHLVGIIKLLKITFEYFPNLNGDEKFEILDLNNFAMHGNSIFIGLLF